jgi:hypothetical protein
MNETGRRILEHLAVVATERARREADPSLDRRAIAIKAYQQARFARTHAGLLAHPRYAPAARFFLEELYGPRDFSARDAQFERIVPTLVRMFPGEIVETVEKLAAVHALSERLDSAMAGHLEGGAVTRVAYVRAWRETGNPAVRERQIDLVLQVGQALERYTRSTLLRTSLRVMRGPAKAAGMGSLQQFLEAGFDAFAAMKGSEQFLADIDGAERALVERLFAADAMAVAQSAAGPPTGDVLGQLP